MSHIPLILLREETGCSHPSSARPKEHRHGLYVTKTCTSSEIKRTRDLDSLHIRRNDSPNRRVMHVHYIRKYIWTSLVDDGPYEAGLLPDVER